MARKNSGKSASASTATKSKSSGKAAKQAAAAPAPEPTPTPEPVATETAAPVTTAESLEAQFVAINTRLAELRALESSIVQDVRKLQKTAMKYIKEVSKKSRRRRAAPADGEAKRPPSGFAKPALISNELCSFLGKPTGTEMARTEVTKFLTSYIKEHNLQDPENKRRIRPDKKLAKLLNTTNKDEVTYFNLQKYMKVHFPPSKASAAKV